MNERTPDASATTSRHKLLQVYLDDHLGAAAAGARRAKRLADAEAASADGPRLRQLATDIEEDRQALVAVADGLGIAQRRYKQVVAAVAERLGLLKLNGRLLRRSPLTSVVETEMLVMAVRGKLAGWQTLSVAVGADEARTATGGAVDLDGLISRARQQLDAFAELHAAAAARALGPEQASGPS